ncbi:MAG: PIN domain-containing protein [Pyrinomonadaceae bacterium]|nr:PIN domain-containing protein [Pyrinomonadaceae bacterium]
MRVLLDTDVTLDFLLERKPFFEAASELFELSANGKFDAYLAAITPINVFYLGRKVVGAPKIRQGIAELLRLVRISNISKESLEKALGLPFADYEDAVQHCCATAEGLEAIVTRNVTDYKNSTLPVFTPVEFLSHIKSLQP